MHLENQNPIIPSNDIAAERKLQKRDNFYIKNAIVNEDSNIPKATSPPRPKTPIPEKAQSKEEKVLENTNKGFSIKRSLGIQNKKVLSPSKTVDQDAVKLIFDNKSSFKNETGKYDYTKIYNFLTGRTNARGEEIKSPVNKADYDGYFKNLVDNGKKYDLKVKAQLGGFGSGEIKGKQEPWKEISSNAIVNTLQELGISEEHHKLFLDFARLDSANITDEQMASFQGVVSKLASEILNNKLAQIKNDGSLSVEEKSVARKNANAKFMKLNTLDQQIREQKKFPFGFIRFEPQVKPDAGLKERIYISMNPAKADELMDFMLKEFLAENAKKYPGISEIKVSGPVNASSRDGIVIYVAHEDRKIAEEVRQNAVNFIKNLKANSPDLFGDANHPFKNQHAPGLASVSVVGAESYTELAAKKIAEELNSVDENKGAANLNFQKLSKKITEQITSEINNTIA